MMNVLINAYAVSPSLGSEQGVGWNWAINIARFCNVHVITEGEWRKEIEKAIADLPQKDNIHFYYLPVSCRVRRMCWNQGDWRFYLHYALWQRRALNLARRIIENNTINVIHQLNMVGFREPGLLWRIKGIPFVWGPVCGFAPIALTYFSSSRLLVRIKYAIKNLINWIQFRYHPRVRKAFKRAISVITPSEECSKLISSVYNIKPIIIPETGVTYFEENTFKINNDDKTINLLWIGRFIDSKKLDIAIRTMSIVARNVDCRLHIVGSGSEYECNKYRKLADELSVSDRCIWYGKIEHEKALEMMTKMDALFFSSVNEATSTVVLEAIQNNLPVICHDCCGFGPIINDKIGRKIPLTDVEGSANLFAGVIMDFAANKEQLGKMKNNFHDVALSLTYYEKARVMATLYNDISHK